MAETLQRDEIVVRDIIDTARVLFKKSGFKKTTMGDIARSLGKAKSSLYYYYPSKEDIFEAVLHSEMDELLKQIQQSIRHAATSKEKLTIYCRCRLVKLNELCNLSDALKSEIGELHELHCIMTDLKRQFDTTHVGLVREILDEGVHNGEFKKINKDNIELVAYLMVSSFRGLAVPLMVSQNLSPKLDLQIDSIVDIMVEGIARQAD
ncbi:MAG TPA: TetR/AcrR family transcriptional regulator [Puia sp.]|jgi:AcrR family transcriptional regulator|nr:TetR/AcrR family transcriptional regulator [Puia sp.]